MKVHFCSMYAYQIFDLLVHAELALPELLLATRNTLPDILVHVGETISPPQDQEGWHVLSSKKALLHWHKVGTLTITDGTSIVVNPVANVEARLLRNVVITTGMNMILYQRGYFLMHASVVEVAGRAVAFCGASGWGKSTLAAAMGARGHALVADDVLCVDLQNSSLRVLPAFPQLKLYPDSLRAVGASPDPLPRLYDGDDKRLRRVDDNFTSQMLPLACIYMLERGDATAILPVNGQVMFPTLLRHSYVGNFQVAHRINLLAHSNNAQSFMDQAAQLIRSVPIRRLQRSWNLSQIGAVVDLVEQDVAESQ
jgi:hypothetical protein